MINNLMIILLIIIFLLSVLKVMKIILFYYNKLDILKIIIKNSNRNIIRINYLFIIIKKEYDLIFAIKVSLEKNYIYFIKFDAFLI